MMSYLFSFVALVARVHIHTQPISIYLLKSNGRFVFTPAKVQSALQENIYIKKNIPKANSKE